MPTQYIEGIAGGDPLDYDVKDNKTKTCVINQNANMKFNGIHIEKAIFLFTKVYFQYNLWLAGLFALIDNKWLPSEEPHVKLQIQTPVYTSMKHYHH